MNRFSYSILTLFFSCLTILAIAQEDTRVLATVNNIPVTVSEFTYIYSKTTQDKADFSEASLREYLDLYTRFKLKVQRARDLQLDTMPALRSELDGYRRQLANSYLTDKEVTEKLVREAYERSLTDVEISHIFFFVDKSGSAKDTLEAYQNAMTALNAIRKGTKFEEAAVQYSQDKSAAENKGYLGFVVAMLPDGFYDMETGIYQSKDGEVSGPFRSPSGYHIVKVHSRRPARGMIEVAHILIRNPKEGSNAEAQQRIRAAHAQLKSGSAWDEVVASVSDDKSTSDKGGYLGSFGINQYQKSFEDAAFNLKNDGDFSEPIETSIGWHIVKRISRTTNSTFEDQRRSLTDQVKRDARSQVAKQHMLDRIKKEAQYKSNPELIKKWVNTQSDSVFTSFRWAPAQPADQTVIASFGNTKNVTMYDFELFCERSARERMRAAGSEAPLSELIDRMFKDFEDDILMQYEESQLDKKYPEFKSLMREYEEGILLFDATKTLVWDRANIDSVGLEKFYNTELKGRYQWDERAEVEYFSVKSTDKALVEKIRTALAKKKSADVLKKFNKKAQIVTVSSKFIEKGKAKEEMPAEMWKVGATSPIQVNQESGSSFFSRTLRIAPPTDKALSECRGYAVADYQDYLEKQWVSDLRKQYPVTIDENVLKTMFK